MEVIDLNSPAISEPSVSYAGFLLRFIAYLIDRLLIEISSFVGIISLFSIFGALNWTSIAPTKNLNTELSITSFLPAL